MSSRATAPAALPYPQADASAEGLSMPRRFLMSLLRRTPRPAPAPKPAPARRSRVHNYDNDHRYWGHDFTMSPDESTPGQVTATGWGYGIEEGDHLLVGRPGAPWRLKVVDIAYGRDPRDLWFATLTVALRPPLVPPQRWDGSAGQFLQNALSGAGVHSRVDGDGTGEYIVVPVGAHGLITITGTSGRAKENELRYRPSEHQGWGAVLHPDVDEKGGGDFTEVYWSASPDLAEDTARVARAVQDVIAGRSAN